MAIYTSRGRYMMAKAFYDYAKGSETSPLWFGFARGLDNSSYAQSDYDWSELGEINGGTPITEDVPPDPIVYPGPKATTLTNTNDSAPLPVKYYSSTDFPPEIYKRVMGVQFIYPDPAGSIVYLENTYSEYTLADANTNNCNLVRVSANVSTMELASAQIDPENFTTRQIGLYNSMPSGAIQQTRPNLVLKSDLTSLGGESVCGLCLVDNTLPYHRVAYQRDEFSFVLQF